MSQDYDYYIMRNLAVKVDIYIFPAFHLGGTKGKLMECLHWKGIVICGAGMCSQSNLPISLRVIRHCHWVWGQNCSKMWRVVKVYVSHYCHYSYINTHIKIMKISNCVHESVHILRLYMCQRIYIC